MRKPIPLLLFLHSFVFLNVVAAPIDSSKSVAFRLTNEGFIGGKAGTQFWRNHNVPLNNHGYLYNGTLLESSFHNALTLKTRFRVWNGEMSVFDQYNYQFEPELILHLKGKKVETVIHGGYLNDITLGSGLTVKDFTNSGAKVLTHWNKWTANAGILAKGYGISEDLYWAGLDHGVVPLSLTVLVKNTQGTYLFGNLYENQYYISVYFLPDIKITLPFGSLYGEYGFKLDRRKNVSGIIEESPEKAHAGLLGFKSTYHGRRLIVNGCIEFRTYRKGFIPVTGVDPSMFGTLWDEDNSRANWIDFFDSRRTSYWGYLHMDAEFRLFDTWRIFSRNELLYFHSRQTNAIVYPSAYNGITFDGGIMRYTPSTIFYAAGIRYLFFKKVAAEIFISNKLINTWECSDFTTTQWGQRFIASDQPFGEARLQWHF